MIMIIYDYNSTKNNKAVTQSRTAKKPLRNKPALTKHDQTRTPTHTLRKTEQAVIKTPAYSSCIARRLKIGRTGRKAKLLFQTPAKVQEPTQGGKAPKVFPRFSAHTYHNGT